MNLNPNPRKNLSNPNASRRRPRLRPEAAALLIGLTLAGGAAQAGRPLITEDAGVLGRAECEW